MARHSTTHTLNTFEKVCFPASPPPCFGEAQGSTQGSTHGKDREALSPSLERDREAQGSTFEAKKLAGSFLPQFTSQAAFVVYDVNRMSRIQFGNVGEQWAYSQFEQAGYDVARVGRGDQRGDLRVVDTNTGEVWRIEVKSSRRDSQGRWQVCLKRQIKGRVCTDSDHADYVLILCFPKIGAPIPFLIPSAATNGRKQIAISKDPKTYTGMWAQFRQLDGLKMPDSLRED